MHRDRSWYFDQTVLVSHDWRYEIVRADPTEPHYFVIVDRQADSVMAINGRTSWPFQRDARARLAKVLQGRFVARPREIGELLRVV